MKIVHLNTHSYGGAAVVARRLHLTSLAAGLDSHFITKYGVRSDAIVHYTALRNARLQYAVRAGIAHQTLYQMGKLVQRKLEHRNLANRPQGLEIFSPLNARKRHANCLQDADPTVVHLHWVAGFVDHAAFFERNRARRFVWTLHDMNPFTGGCHHADGCMKFASDCTDCPQLAGTIDQQYARSVLAAKRTALSSLRDDQMVIVAPSRWLLELSMRSPITGRFRHVQVANPTLLAPAPALDRAALRDRLGLPPDRKLVLFVSDNLRNRRKGIDLLFAAAHRLHAPHAVQLVGVGNPTDLPHELQVSFTGHIQEEAQLAQYFAAADVLVVPSVMENSPLTVIEALTCGTPAIVFAVGGAGELIDDDCGVVVDQRSADALARAIDHVLFARKYDPAVVRQKAQRHDPVLVMQQYQAIYNQLADVQ